MTLIVDASVAIKWAVEEDQSEEAQTLLERDDLAAPDLLIAEVAATLWKKELRREITSLQRAVAFSICARGIGELVPMKGLGERALELAVELSHPAYDCFYLALAEAREATFVTADQRLLARLASSAWAGAFRGLEGG